jgi:hypothetical protein
MEANFVLRTNAPLGEFYRKAAAASEIHPSIGVDLHRASETRSNNRRMRDRLITALARAFGGIGALARYRR